MTSILSRPSDADDPERRISTAAIGFDLPPDHLHGHRPHLDEDGVLWFGDRWCAITDRQIPVVEHLLEHLGAMVPVSELVAPYELAGGSADPAALRSLMLRVARQLASVGLEVTFARRRAGIQVIVPAAPGAP